MYEERGFSVVKCEEILIDYFDILNLVQSYNYESNLYSIFNFDANFINYSFYSSNPLFLRATCVTSLGFSANRDFEFNPAGFQVFTHPVTDLHCVSALGVFDQFDTPVSVNNSQPFYIHKFQVQR